MSGKVMYGLVLNLRDSSQPPKILPAKELYALNADMTATKLKPKNSKDFKKNKEYGRIEVVDGEEKIVRHVIFALSESIDDLKAEFKKKEKRFVAPKRQSIAPVVESKGTYKFPDERKELKKKRKDRKETASKSKGIEEAEIYKKLKSKMNSKDKESKVDADSAEKIHEPTLDEKSLDQEARCELPDAWESSPGMSVDSVLLTPETLTFAAEKVIEEERAARASSHPCSSESHKKLNGKLEATLKQLEDANRKIGSLKDQQAIALKKIADLEGKLNSLKNLSIAKDVHEEALEKITSLEKELSTLKDLSAVKDDISSIKDELHSLKVGGGLISGKPTCSLSKLTHNLLSSDEEDVPEDKIKVDDGKYLLKTDIAEIERKTVSKTQRSNKLINLFCNNKPYDYSLSGWTAGGKAVIKITDNEVKSMTKILEAMYWNKPTNITAASIRSRISRFTSHERQEVENAENKIHQKTAGAKRPPKSSMFKADTVNKKPRVEGENKVEDAGSITSGDEASITSGDDAADEDSNDEEDDLNKSIHLT